MAKYITVFSISLFVLTFLWLVYAFLNEPLRWQFLGAGGLHFIASIVVNKQMTFKNYNYLGIAHTVAMIVFFGYGYIAL